MSMPNKWGLGMRHHACNACTHAMTPKTRPSSTAKQHNITATTARLTVVNRLQAYTLGPGPWALIKDTMQLFPNVLLSCPSRRAALPRLSVHPLWGDGWPRAWLPRAWAASSSPHGYRYKYKPKSQCKYNLVDSHVFRPGNTRSQSAPSQSLCLSDHAWPDPDPDFDIHLDHVLRVQDGHPAQILPRLTRGTHGTKHHAMSHQEPLTPFMSRGVQVQLCTCHLAQL